MTRRTARTFESHSLRRGAFETVRNPRRQEYERVRLELNESRATNGQIQNQFETQRKLGQRTMSLDMEKHMTRRQFP